MCGWPTRTLEPALTVQYRNRWLGIEWRTCRIRRPRRPGSDHAFHPKACSHFRSRKLHRAKQRSHFLCDMRSIATPPTIQLPLTSAIGRFRSHGRVNCPRSWLRPNCFPTLRIRPAWPLRPLEKPPAPGPDAPRRTPFSELVAKRRFRGQSHESRPRRIGKYTCSIDITTDSVQVDERIEYVVRYEPIKELIFDVP